MQSSLFVDYWTTDNYLHIKTKCQRYLWHIYIFPNTQTNAKKCKRATKPTHNDTTNNWKQAKWKNGRSANRGFAILGQKCYIWTL